MSPEIYIRAGKKLKSYGHYERGNALIKYVNIQTGLYNITSYQNEYNTCSEYRNIYSGIYSNPTLNIVYTGSHDNAEQFAELWRKCTFDWIPLSIICNFSFSLYEKQYQKDDDIEDKYNDFYYSDSVINKLSSMFIIEIRLCDAIKSSDANKDIMKLYQNYKNIGIYFSTIGGIFSDKKSAIKFKIKLQELLINNDILKDKIMDILNIVNGSSEDLEYIYDLLGKISSNAMYDDNNLNPKPINDRLLTR